MDEIRKKIRENIMLNDRPRFMGESYEVWQVAIDRKEDEWIHETNWKAWQIHMQVSGF